LAATQRVILASASTLLKTGGRLVYATCSLLREENEDVVSGFLATHPDFVIVPAAEVLARRHVALSPEGEFLRLLPHRHRTDGYFAAVMDRRS
jgi:16S rRNA (cytosine967-C5)-methyltransferase